VEGAIVSKRYIVGYRGYVNNRYSGAWYLEGGVPNPDGNDLHAKCPMPYEDRTHNCVSFAYSASDDIKYFSLEDVHKHDITFGIFAIPENEVVPVEHDGVSMYFRANPDEALLLRIVSYNDLRCLAYKEENEALEVVL